MNSVAANIRFALRLWKKSPGYVAIAIGTLALGISANTVIFTGVESFLLRPLPVPEPDRIILLRQIAPKTGAMYGVPYADLLDWRAGAPAFENIAGIQIDTFNLTGAGESERVRGARVTAEFFPVIGLRPVAGRVFSREEDNPESDAVVVVSYALAQRRFGGLAAVGKTLNIDGRTHVIRGVMPAAMRFPMGFSELWVPLAPTGPMAARGSHALAALGRLRPGASIRDANRQLNAVALAIEAESPTTNTGISIMTVPLAEQISRGPRSSLLVLWTAVAFVLLICCANLANLALARSVYRAREFAVRQALGASRWQLLRQVLLESLLVSATGGAAGLILASWGLDLLARIVPPVMQPMGGLVMSLRVFVFTAALSVFTGLVFGVAPAFRTVRGNAADALREGGRSVAGGHARSRLSHVLVVGEVALAVTLLAGAGLLLSALRRMQSTDMGFTPAHVLTAELSARSARYDDDRTRAHVVERVIERLESVPGITHASAVNFPPMTNNTARGYSVDFAPAPESKRLNVVDYRVATPAYAKVMNIDVLKGRFISAEDVNTGEPVAVVNQRFADREWPKQNAVGRSVSLQLEPGKMGPWRRIVGVIRNVRHGGPVADPNPEIYVPFAQAPVETVYLAVRTSRDPAAMSPALQAAVREVDPDLPLALVRPMERVLADAIAPARLTTGLLSIFSALALLLAMMGLYGVIAYLVARRTYEFGVRLALGATAGGLLRLVMKGCFTLTAIGTVAGLLCAFAVSRVLVSLFPGVRVEPAVFAFVAAVLAVVSLGAAWFPLRRALAAGPLQALRAE